MRVAFIGDLVGRPARYLINQNLNTLRDRFNIDFVVANSENASSGFGINFAQAKSLFEHKIDLMTGGNHSWDQQDITKTFEAFPVLRPLNYFDETIGEGYKTVEVKKNEFLTVINLMGYYGMPMVNNPFTVVEKLVNKLNSEYQNKNHSILIDFHAESTAEKNAIFQLLNDRVSAIFGTHTHVGTSDFLLQNNSAYLTDIGLTGCIDGVIGFKPEEPIYKFKTGMKTNFKIKKPTECVKIFQMAVIDIKNNKTKSGFIYRAFAPKNSNDLDLKSENITKIVNLNEF
jgi:metallophosphoesterase (TIGR00282 family)